MSTVAPNWAEEQRRRRQQRVLRTVLAIGLLVALSLGLLAVLRSRSNADAGSTPGFADGSRTISTEPFSPAAPGIPAGPTTIPGGPLGPDGLPVGSTTTSTSTTIPIPPRPEDDPICALATVVVEALRVVTGPEGTTSENLAITAQTFREAADLALLSSLTGTDALAALIRGIADDLPSATDAESAATIYNRLLAPEDPEIVPVAAVFGDHLARECPAILSIEP